MSLSDFSHFRLHSERTEENGPGPSFPDGFKHLAGAIGMIAIDHDRIERQAPDGILDRFRLSQEPRLQTTKLYQKTQQRGDNFLARENQHTAHTTNQRRDWVWLATYEPSRSLASDETIA
jgi:hypothetical protein